MGVCGFVCRLLFVVGGCFFVRCFYGLLLTFVIFVFFFVLVVVCYLFVIFVSCVMFVARCLFGCFLVLFTVLLLVFGSVYCLLLIFDVSHFFDDCYFLFVVCHVLSVFQVLV